VDDNVNGIVNYSIRVLEIPTCAFCIYPVCVFGVVVPSYINECLYQLGKQPTQLQHQ